MLIYTRAYKVVGGRAPQWTARGTNVFILNVLVVNLCVYIKIPRKIYFKIKYKIIAYIYMIIRYYMHNILLNMVTMRKLHLYFKMGELNYMVWTNESKGRFKPIVKNTIELV